MMNENFSWADINASKQKKTRTPLLYHAFSLAPPNETVIVGGKVKSIVYKMSKRSFAHFDRSLQGWKCFLFKTFSLTNALSSTIAENILFLHLMSWCDTMSVMFMQGQMKFLKTVLKNLILADVVKVSNKSNANREIAAAGEHFLVSLCDYCETNVPSLNHLRYISHKKSVDTIRTLLLYHNSILQKCFIIVKTVVSLHFFKTKN